MAKLFQFHADRRPRWRRLDDLLRQVDADGPLGGRETDELYRLYRLAASDLAFMQTHTGNPVLLEYLEDLVARAHSRLTPPADHRLLAGLYRLLRYDFPAVVIRELRLLFLVAAIFAGGGVFGAAMAWLEPEAAETFLAPFPNLLDQAPSQDAARRYGTRLDPVTSVAFSLHLFAHNLRVALLCLAFGLTFGVGTVAILFANGVILGCVFMLYAADGALEFLLAWVGPHASLEIPAMLFAGLAGLMLARAQVGGGGVWRTVTACKRDYLAVIAGCGLLLLLAGGIEGGFSQAHALSLNLVKIGVGVACFLALLAWIFLLPRPAENQSSSRPALFDR
ncbi:MAG: stage II sporulation protein M [Planctomycetes bacterium]|nr:stage II sporulation protein M [Planctomycetota bacterium]